MIAPTQQPRGGRDKSRPYGQAEPNHARKAACARGSSFAQPHRGHTGGVCRRTPHLQAGLCALKRERELAIIMVTRITFHTKPAKPKRKRRRQVVGFVKRHLETFGWLWWIDVDTGWLTRHAVISQVHRLRSKGWQIETVPRKGYKLIARPEMQHSTDAPAPRQPKQNRPSHPQFVRRLLLEHGHLWLDEVAAESIAPEQLRQQVYWLRQKGWEIETTPRGYLLHSRPPDDSPAPARHGFVKNHLRRYGRLKWADATLARLSRRVVYGQVQRLRTKGWQIENLPGEGYKLIATPQSQLYDDTPTQPASKSGGRWCFVKRHLLQHGHLWPEEVAGESISRKQLRGQVYWLRKKGWEIETTARGWVLHSRTADKPRASARPGFVEKHLQRRGSLSWTEATRAGVSRHVVHAQVRRLRRKGWRIENTPRGVRLQSIPRPAPRGTPKSLTRLSDVKRRG